ncbi:SSI family serine proteinase inhibitor [Streptomyces sp. NPDC093105]|uniref:SSI family serine proteinase inhibitor n=1 Tax=Streptomyces sp. NPDC093105 TaxID=3366029 RepID=UPI00380F7073
MRRLLTTALAAATTTLVTTLCAAAAPLPGVAPGAASLHLTRAHVSEGGRIVSAGHVHLDCPADASAPHPYAREACRDVRGAAGDLDRLPGTTFAFCADEPGTTVTVTADGVYEGRPVRWTRTYVDDCVRALATGQVFDF